MKKEKLLTLLVILLLLLNISIIIFFVFIGHERPPMGPPKVDKLITETLNLDEKQIARFNTMKREHHHQMMQLDKQYVELLQQYFELLNVKQLENSSKDSLENMVEKIQLQKAQITFRHFQELKSLCRPDQIERFQELIPELSKIILPHPPKSELPPPRREGN